MAAGAACAVARLGGAAAAAAIKCTRAGGRAGMPERAEVSAFLSSRG
jgi:sugar/nucleoside kinase (ribokinase family)